MSAALLRWNHRHMCGALGDLRDGRLLVLSRAWSILDYTGLATLYLTLGRGEGSLMVGVEKREVDDHIVYVYGVYIHREYITVTAV